jgi:ABC-type glycerol-3-phosphate transport system substrate-binding protein
MRTRTFWTMLLLAVFLLAACGSEEPTRVPTAVPVVVEPTEETAPPEDAGVTETEVVEAVTVKMAMLDLELGRYDAMIEAFEEENPDINVQTVSIEELLGI